MQMAYHPEHLIKLHFTDYHAIILLNSLECTMSKVTNGHSDVDDAELDRSVGEQFLSEALKVILEEAVHKATDVKEKVS